MKLRGDGSARVFRLPWRGCGLKAGAMCGIAGYWTRGKVDPALLERMQSFLAHPGPAERRLMLSRYLIDVFQKIDDLAKVPTLGIAEILERAADQYRAALRFEDGWPGPTETLGWMRRAGPRHIARMFAKRASNRIWEKMK